MNLFFKSTLFIFVILLVIESRGQTMFRQGYVITNENDTIHGFIDFRGDVRNAKKCDFKTSQNSEVKEYTPFSIKGYRFNNGKYYISRRIKSGETEIEIFLEFLVRGISNLYYYADNMNFHYFIEKSDGQLIELTNEQKKVTVDGTDYIHETKSYIGLLRYAFGDCPQIFPAINQAKLEDKSLIEITKKYHEIKCDGQKCIIYEKQLPVIKVTFGTYVSMNSSFLKILDNPVYELVHLKMISYPSIGLMLNTSLPRTNDKFSLQLAGELSKNSFYGTGLSADRLTFEEVYLKSSLLKLKGGIKYTYPKGKIKPTFLLGGIVNWSFHSEGKRLEEIIWPSAVFSNEFHDARVPDVLIGFNIEMGFDFNITSSKLAFINLGYSNVKGVNSFNTGSENSYSAHLNTIQINAGIYF